ncbi:hypothetical protein ZWY2020_002575 [Hordeum vulgare]|nr:hypothetical protein ZWY2020_002575 [Hordeum vulgare]
MVCLFTSNKAVSKAAEAKPSSKPPRALPRVATMRAPTNTAVTSGISDKRSNTGGVVNRQTIAKSANSSANVPSRPGGGTKNNSTSKSGALSSAASSSLHSAPMAASTVGRASHTSETFSTRSSSLSPSTRKSNDHPPTTLPRPQIVAEGQASRTFFDNVKSDVNTSTQGNGFKPSSLRRPTPKIGYFDAEKSVEQKAGARAQLQPTKLHELK